MLSRRRKLAFAALLLATQAALLFAGPATGGDAIKAALDKEYVTDSEWRKGRAH